MPFLVNFNGLHPLKTINSTNKYRKNHQKFCGFVLKLCDFAPENIFLPQGFAFFV